MNVPATKQYRRHDGNDQGESQHQGESRITPTAQRRRPDTEAAPGNRFIISTADIAALQRDHEKQQAEKKRTERHRRRKLRRLPGDQLVNLRRINLQPDGRAEQQLDLESLKRADNTQYGRD